MSAVATIQYAVSSSMIEEYIGRVGDGESGLVIWEHDPKSNVEIGKLSSFTGPGSAILLPHMFEHEVPYFVLASLVNKSRYRWNETVIQRAIQNGETVTR